MTHRSQNSISRRPQTRFASIRRAQAARRSFRPAPFLVPITVLVLFVAAGAGTRCVDAQEVTIATYNVENMFDVFDDPYTDDESADPKRNVEIRAIAGAIRAIGPDVVAFQELENEPLLRAMVLDFLPGEGYEHILVEPTNSGRGINLGVISRFPIRRIVSHRRLPIDHPPFPRMARDLLRVELEIDADTRLDLYVVHLKSRRDGKGDPNSVKWRTAEARLIRAVLERSRVQRPERPYLLVGDFNANPDNETMTLLLDDEPRAGDAAQPGEQGGSRGAEPLLQDVHAGLATEQRITYPSDRYPDTIFDYILAGPQMAERLKPGSPIVFRDPTLTRGSDHLLVVATFEFDDGD